MDLPVFMKEAITTILFEDGTTELRTLSQMVLRAWQYAFHDLGDKRIAHWPMMADPLPTVLIIIMYLLFVTKIGPKIMENREPLELKNVLIVYNFIQVCVSIWIVSQSVELYWNKYSFFSCENVEVDASEETMRICRGFYVYYLAKVSELLDTVFFVLRKKYNQITFLHLYHHTGMPIMSWGCAKYFPGGHAAFLGLINSSVHIFMYFYYMLAAMGPQIQKYLWWKRWITILQLIQFALGFLHFSQVLNSDCNYPKWAVIIVFPNAFFFYYLFWDFYRKAYKPKRIDFDSPSDQKTIDETSPNGQFGEGNQLRKRNKETGIQEN
uniref:Elongation of very long chain fatty acids protein n=2 Tax=Lygus hesperus TaxID=30085 RepID=A0A0K8S4K6_LYGHE